ncbi:hypothetical protein [Candidatus Endomicrobiellum trichonymphae]|nr:hypothetical protein [Candidatus Endomicrobium trichonymphae]
MNGIRSDIIIADDVRFQIKTESGGKPWNKSTIANELLAAILNKLIN